MGRIKIILKALKYVLQLLVFLLGICTIRTAILNLNKGRGLQPCVKDEAVGYIEVNENMWERFRESIKIKSVSYSPGVFEESEVIKLQSLIIQGYPAIFNSKFVSYDIINNYSLLIQVHGSDENLDPYLLSAHMDVVPVVQDKWSVNAFAAVERDGKLYGRGTLDDKARLLSILEAVSHLLRRGHQPKRGFYLAFGHDEETAGHYGATGIAEELKKKGVERLHLVLDEGFLVLSESMEFVKDPVALVGISEKGYMTCNISVQLAGGHSSIPGIQSAVSLISRSVAKLESKQLPRVIDKIFSAQLHEMSFVAAFPYNILLSNMWFFKPLLTLALQNAGPVSALLGTTHAITMIGGGIKENVIPTSAWAVVNFRTHPKDSTEDVINFLRNTINDNRVKIEITEIFQSHPISPHNPEEDLPYQVLSDTINQVIPGVPVVPALFVARTDSFHYMNFTNAIYLFQPAKVAMKDAKRIHGEDEFITRENYEREINFFHHFILNADRDELRKVHQNADL